MFGFRSIAAILAGCFFLHGLAGCQTSPGRRVVWLKETPGTSRIDEEPTAATAGEAGYKPVGEYSLAKNSAEANETATHASGESVGEPSSESVSPNAHKWLGKKTSPVRETASAQQDAPQHGVSEPVESQQRLVPQFERKPGFWERFGNGFRNLSDLARGQRPVNALAVLPFQPKEKKPTRKQEIESRAKPISIPAFTLQSPDSIAQATSMDDALESPASDLVSHWSEYPASEMDDVAKSQAEPAVPPLRNSQATASP